MPISGSFCGAQSLSLSDERADAMLDKGDLGGYAVWRRIVKATEELLSKDRPDGAALQ